MIKNSQHNFVGILTAAGVIISALAFAVYFTLPYAESVALGTKMVGLVTVLLSLGALFCVLAVHTIVLRHTPSRGFVVGMAGAFVPILYLVFAGVVDNGGAVEVCYQPAFGLGMYYVGGYIMLLVLSHVYVLLYGIRYKLITHMFSKEAWAVVASLMLVAALSYMIMTQQTLLYGKYAIVLAYLGCIILSYTALSRRRYGSALVNSGVLIPLLIVVLTSIVFLKDASLIHILVIVSGVLAFSVGYVLDRAMRRQTDYELLLQDQNTRLKDLDQTRSDFLSFATHQLQAPLTALRWGLAATFDAKSSHEKEDIIRQLETVVSRMSRTVGDFLNSTKFESGVLALHKTNTDITRLMATVAEEFVWSAKLRGLELVVENPTTEIYAWIDEQKISQVVANLIDNAIKYTEIGTVTISADKHLHDLIIMISDTGQGVSDAEMRTLFKKYHRGQNRHMNSNGSGIGLYLAKIIIEKHDGTIEVARARAGKGASFVITLPIKEGV